MPQLRKIAMSRIGHPQARLDGLTVDLCDQGTATDTILWGDNGTGKTSLLHLFFSIFHPETRKFLGKAGDSERSFDLYFKLNEVSFVVTEWEDNPDPANPDKKQIRIVGRCIQRISSHETKNDEYGPSYFFSFLTDDTTDLDILPLTQNVCAGRAEYIRSPAQFRSWFDTAFRDKHHLSPKIVRDNYSEWQQHLSSIGFDLDVIELLMLLSHGEGATGGLLERFKKDEDFIGFLVDILADPKSCKALREQIELHSADLREEPRIRDCLQYNAALHGLVMDMSGAAKLLLEAEVTEAEAKESASKSHTRLIGTQKTVETEMNDKQAEHTGLSTSIDKARLEKNYLTGGSNWLVQERARLVAQEAVAEMTAAEGTQRQAARAETVGKSLVAWNRVLSAKQELDSVDEEIAVRQTTTLPYLERVNNAGARYKELVDAKLGAIETDLSSCRGELQAGTARHADITRRQSDENSKKAVCETQLAEHKKQEEERRKSYEGLCRYKLVQEPETAAAALQRIKDEMREVDGAKTAATAELNEVLSDEGTLVQQVGAIRSSLDKLTEECARKRKGLEVFQNDLAAITAEGPLLNFLKELDDPYAPGLMDECLYKRKEIGQAVYSCAQDQDSIRTILGEMEANKGLVPPAADVAHIVTLLGGESIEAVPYWHVFNDQVLTDEEIATRLQQDPSRYSGIAVHKKEDLDKARGVVGMCRDIKTPVQISWYGDVSPPSEEMRVIFQPDFTLFCNKRAAQKRRQELEGELEELIKTSDWLNGQYEEADKAINSLSVFLGKYQHGYRENLEAGIATLSRKMGEEERALAEKQETLTVIIARKKGLESQLADLTARSTELVQTAGPLELHIARHEEKAAGRQDAITELTQKILVYEEILEGLKGEAAKEAELSAKANETLQGLIAQRSVLNGMLAEIMYINGSSQAVPETVCSIEIAKKHYDEAFRDYERQNMDLSLAKLQGQREMCHRTWTEERGEYTRLYAEVTEEEQDVIAARYPGKTEAEILEALAGEMQHANATLAVAQARRTETMAALKELKGKSATLVTTAPDSRPATSEEALRMLNEVSDRLDGIRDQLAALEEQEKQVNLRLVEIKGEITLLNSAIQAAAGFCEPWKGYLAPYGTAKEANLAWTDAKTSFEEAEKMTLKRRKGVDTHVGKIRTLIYDERQSAADIQTTHQFRDQLNNLYRECDTVAEKLNDVIASMASRLSHFELNKKDIVDQLAFDCRDIIKRIEDINNVSKLPNMGTLWEIWRGRAFVKFDVRQEVKNEDYIRSRLEEYLLHLVRNEKDRLPSPMDLLFNALRYVLDNKYRVSTLRPFTNPTIKYYRISEKDGLGGWSGGERLTGAILFCLSLAELMRLHRHGTVKKSEAGFLLIDNPFGTTTSQDYINIQFALARRFNVQLIATTNIKQSDILASFPKIIGLKQIGVDKVSRDTYIAEATDSCPEIAEAYLKRRRNAAREAAA